MKRISGTILVRLVICLLVAVLLAVSAAWAKPTTPDQAKKVVLNWLGKDAVPLGAPLGRQIKEVQTFTDGAGAPAYYVVYLKPAGLVFLPADDLVEPIIGFLPEGYYDPSPLNPLGALVNRDIPGRVLQAREVEAKGLEALAPETPQAKAQRKWDRLANPAILPDAAESGLPTTSITDLRVDSFVQSRWNQLTVNNSVSGLPCYNYYTPYCPADSVNHVSGCVATSMSQLMRYWQYPASPVPGTFSITVDGVAQNATLRGGNGSGGPYAWASMILDPLHYSGLTDAQRAAIGSLTFDAGVSVNMDYESFALGGSSASGALKPAVSLVSTFKYSNARSAWTGSQTTNILSATLYKMVNPNLDALFPVMLGIYGAGGHSIICDGYGYQTVGSSTMYHHLNMGWAGSDDAWYNLPTINTSNGNFNVVAGSVYNVFVTGSGEIISGRVTDSAGNPLSGATVTATGGGNTYPAIQKDVVATTTSSGIYAIPKVPPSTTVTVSVTKAGYTFSSQQVTTGASTSASTTTGNLWGINFVGSGAPAIGLNQALDNTKLSFNTGGAANWSGEATTYYYGGSAAQSGAITDSQNTQLWTTVTGPGTLSFYWKVSSEEGYDSLDVFLGDTWIAGISGEVNWTQKTLSIPAGIHIVTWQYAKDVDTGFGSDCGWVDKVVYSRPGVAAISLLLLN